MKKSFCKDPIVGFLFIKSDAHLSIGWAKIGFLFRKTKNGPIFSQKSYLRTSHNKSLPFLLSKLSLNFPLYADV